MYDCIVVGVGAHGSAALAHLAKNGSKVLGLEQFKPVHNHGMNATCDHREIFPVLMIYTLIPCHRIVPW